MDPSIKENELRLAVFNEEIEKVRKLLEDGVNPNTCDDQLTYPVLLAFEDDSNEILKLLLDHPDIDLHVIDSNRRGMLHYAAECNNIEIIKCLLTTHNFTPDMLDVDLITPLEIAVVEEHYDAAVILIDAGAKITLVSMTDLITDINNSNTYFPHFLSNFHGMTHDIIFNLIVVSIKNDNYFAFESLINTYPDQFKYVVRDDSHYLPILLIAARYSYGDKYVVKLLENGANVNVKGLNDNNALHIAIKDGYKDIVITLLKYNIDCSHKNNKRLDALALAIKYNNGEIIKLIENHINFLEIKEPDVE